MLERPRLDPESAARILEAVEAEQAERRLAAWRDGDAVPILWWWVDQCAADDDEALAIAPVFACLFTRGPNNAVHASALLEDAYGLDMPADDLSAMLASNEYYKMFLAWWLAPLAYDDREDDCDLTFDDVRLVALAASAHRGVPDSRTRVIRAPRPVPSWEREPEPTKRRADQAPPPPREAKSRPPSPQAGIVLPEMSQRELQHLLKERRDEAAKRGPLYGV